jgi:L-threonylcarbamoyladenylate synthase
MNMKNDDLFIYPTDTVWGIGCSLYSEKGQERISEIKRSAKNKPLSIMFANTEILHASFSFPKEVTLTWLQDFFKLETTLGFPLARAKIKIPKWATGESSFVSVRCLENKIISEIYNEITTPFFSTSLNLTGEHPITQEMEARKFQEIYAPDAHFVNSKRALDLSGSSSTIIFLNENLNFEIKREGARIEEVKNQLMKLFY